MLLNESRINPMCINFFMSIPPIFKLMHYQFRVALAVRRRSCYNYQQPAGVIWRILENLG